MKLTGKRQAPAALSPGRAVSIPTEYKMTGAYSQAGHFKRPEKSLQLQWWACTNSQVLQFGALNHQCCYLTVRSHITLRISRLFFWSFVSTIPPCNLTVFLLNFHLPFTWRCSEIPLLPITKCTSATKWMWGSIWTIQTFLALYWDNPLLYQHTTLLQIFLNNKQQRCTGDK